MHRSKHKPAVYSLILVAGDLLGRPKAPWRITTKCARPISSGGVRSLYIGVL